MEKRARPLLRRIFDSVRVADITAPQPVEQEKRGWFSVQGANIYGFYGAQNGSDAGVSVTIESALRARAHWACVRILCTSMSTMGVKCGRDEGDQFTPVNPQPPIVRQPAPSVSQAGFVYQAMASALTAGNVYADLGDFDRRGKPQTAETIHPDKVLWRPDGGRLRPHVNGKVRDVWPVGDLLHIPAFLMPGSPVGLSPVDYAAQSIGTALATERYVAQYFGDGANPTALVYADAEMDSIQAQQLKERVMAATRGNREPLVMGSDLKVEPWGVNPEHTQYIDLLRFEVEEAARTYGVPPSMIYAAVSGQSVTYANASQADLAYLKYSLSFWIDLLQTAWSSLLPGGADGGLLVRFDEAALLRADTLSRYQHNEIALQNRFKTVNEVRREEHLAPFPGSEFNEPGVPTPPGALPPKPFTPGTQPVRPPAPKN